MNTTSFKLDYKTASQAYSKKYFGYEFIYVQKKESKEKILLFENRLAINGVWLATDRLNKLVQIYSDIRFNETNKLLIEIGDKIVIESYKQRLSTYKPNGNLTGSWDVYCDYLVIENHNTNIIKKPFSLTNKEISENYNDYEFHLMLSDFRGAFAYWLIVQEINYLDINRPLDAFTKFIEQKYFKHNDIVKLFTYNQLNKIISVNLFTSIPEIMELNEMNPNFYSLGALSRNIFYMICREKITQPN